MKKGLCFIIIILLLAIYVYTNKNAYVSFFSLYKEENTHNYTIKRNSFSKQHNFKYVQITDDFYAKNKKHLENILYTFLDSGMETFEFECTYDNCLNDLDMIFHDEISYINSFVHPFNSYHLLTISKNNKNVTIDVDPRYRYKEILFTQYEITKATKSINSRNIKNNIVSYHNYIVKNATYDKEAEKTVNAGYDVTNGSNKAYGLFLNKKAICTGYTDAISIYLWRYNIPNYRIISETHTWNYLYLNDKWYHLDATWDDPANIEIVDDTYLLISTKKLKTLEHKSYNSKVYLEAK